MRRSLSAILAIAVSVGGCSARTAGKVGTVFGGAVFGVGLAMKGGAFGPGGETDPEDVAFVPLTIGALIALPSLLLWLAHRDDKDEDDEESRPPPPKPAAPDPKVAIREHAWQLTQQAAAAARGNDCPTVAKLDGEVRTLDADFHATVFARDVAIVRCLSGSLAPVD